MDTQQRKRSMKDAESVGNRLGQGNCDPEQTQTGTQMKTSYPSDTINPGEPKKRTKKAPTCVDTLMHATYCKAHPNELSGIGDLQGWENPSSRGTRVVHARRGIQYQLRLFTDGTMRDTMLIQEKGASTTA